MKETELNEVLNYMKQYVENKYEHASEPMLTYKDLQLVLEEIERLNKDNGDIIKLFAKEREETKRLHSIIKEAREYLINTNYDSEIPNLMKILDKESDNNG